MALWAYSSVWVVPSTEALVTAWGPALLAPQTYEVSSVSPESVLVLLVRLPRSFYDPLVCEKINGGIVEYLAKYGIATNEELIGSIAE